MDPLEKIAGQSAMSVEIRPPVAILSVAPHGATVMEKVAELERRNQPVTLVSLGGGDDRFRQSPADVVPVPRLSLAVLSSVALLLTRRPLRIARCLRFLRPSNLLLLPAAIHMARVLPGRGIASIEGADPVAARLAPVVRALFDPRPPDMSELPVEWQRLDAHRIGVRWFSQRINCVAAEISIDGRERRLIVKRQRGDAGRTAVERAVHEYRVMQLLERTIANETLTVPGVLLFDEQAATLVMERADGERFDTLFGMAARDGAVMRQLVDGVRGSGRWLAAMQTATRSTADPHALLSEVVAQAEQDAAKMAASDRSMARRHRVIASALRDLERRLRERPLFVVGHHGDYWPGNVFFDGRRVTVIDFEGFRDGLWLEDAAYFLIRSDMLRRRFRLPFRDIADRFFEGFGERPDLDALRLFTLTKGLRTLANATGDDLPLPQRLWTRRSLRKAVFKALRDWR